MSHSVTDRLLGHMNVLLAEAEAPYYTVLEMDEINEGFPSTDRTVDLGSLGPVRRSAVVVRFFHFPTVFGLMP